MIRLVLSSGIKEKTESGKKESTSCKALLEGPRRVFGSSLNRSRKSSTPDKR